MFAVDQNVGNPGSTIMCILSQAGIRAKRKTVTIWMSATVAGSVGFPQKGL